MSIETLHDGILGYKPGHMANAAKCHVQLLRDEETGKYLCIATEIAENPGKSVTNACEHIANQVLKDSDYVIEPESLIFLEHYSVASYNGGGKYALQEYEHYDDVQFSWENGKAHHPQWKPMHGEELALLFEQFGLIKMNDNLEATLNLWHETFRYGEASEYDFRETLKSSSTWKYYHQNISRLLCFNFLEPEHYPATLKTPLHLTERARAHISKMDGI